MAADSAVLLSTGNPSDVNRDGQVSPMDALLVINELNRINQGTTSEVVRADRADDGTLKPFQLDVNRDTYVSPLDALLVINQLNSLNQAAEGVGGAVRVRLDVIDMATGELVSVGAFSVGAAEELGIRVWVRDLAATDTGGVRAAYLDFVWDQDIIAMNAPVEFGPLFPNGRSGSLIGRSYDELGAADGEDPTGPFETLLATIPFSTSGVGEINFDMNPADGVGKNFELYDLIGTVDPSDVEFQGLTWEIAPGRRPTASVDNYIVSADRVFTIAAAEGLLQNDSDGDAEALFVVVESPPTHGTLTWSPDGAFTYEPQPGYRGPDAFTYRASDGTFNSFLATVTLTVSDENSPPVGLADHFTVVTGQSLVVSALDGLLANDTDPDGDALTAIVVTPPNHGELVLQPSGALTYVPDAGFLGADSFTYRVSDGTETSAPIEVTLQVIEPPLIEIALRVVDSNRNPIGETVTGAAFFLQGIVDDLRDDSVSGGVFGAYADVRYDAQRVTPSGAIIFSSLYPNAHSGVVSEPGLVDEVGALDGLTPLGSAAVTMFEIPFTAEAVGRATFTVDPADIPLHEILLYGDSNAIPVSRVRFTATTLNIVLGNRPTAGADAYLGQEDQILTVPVANGLLRNDTDIDGDPLTAILVRDAESGTVQLAADGSFVYIPDNNFHGTDSFTYAAFDGAISSLTTTVTITVAPQPDVPLAANDTYVLQQPNTTLIISATAGVLANDQDPDGTPVTAQLLTSPSTGSLTFQPDGSFVYTPANNFVGFESFTYRVQSNGDFSAPATVTLQVGNPNAPVSLRGMVYFDIDDDGVRDAGEPGFGGVEITLSGTETSGTVVSRTVLTGRDGTYEFTNLRRGIYTVREGTLPQLIDGRDSRRGPGQENDAWTGTLLPGTEVSDINFGERGVRPEFITNGLFLNARQSHGVLAGVDTSGRQSWYCVDAGWDDYTRVDVSLSADGQRVTVLATNTAGQLLTTSLSVTSSTRVRVLGNSQLGYVVRLNGPSTDFAWTLVGQNQSGLAAAVDSAFQN